MRKVLLIEQETLYQRAFSRMMEGNEDTSLIGIAENGMEAIEMVNQYHPEFIFSEVQLGKENGIDICKAIKKNYPATTIFIVSNYRNVNLVNKAMQAGMENYLLKPLSASNLADLFEESHMQQQEENLLLKQLYIAIEDRDYKMSYEVVKEYVDDVFAEMDIQKRKEAFINLASSILYMTPGLDRSQHDYYMKKYDLNRKILSKNVLSCCWIMQILTETFRQLCVMKYGHMNRVLQYIENNINNEISLSDLSEQAGVSSGYLSRIFKKYYNISVVDYIHMRKILVAKQYMVSSEMNISDISFLLGYSEAGYFCKIFKKYENMTPSAFNHAYL